MLMYIKVLLVLCFLFSIWCTNANNNTDSFLESGVQSELVHEVTSNDSENILENTEKNSNDVLIPNIIPKWIDDWYVSWINYPSWYFKDRSFKFYDINKADVALGRFQIKWHINTSDEIQKIEVQHIIYDDHGNEKINDSYFLQEYKTWDRYFQYNPSVQSEVLVEWKNKYKFIWHIDDTADNLWEITFTLHNFASRYQIEDLWVEFMYPNEWWELKEEKSIPRPYTFERTLDIPFDEITSKTSSNSLSSFTDLMDSKTNNAIDFEKLCNLEHESYSPNSSRENQQLDLNLDWINLSGLPIYSNTKNWSYTFINCDLRDTWVLWIFNVYKNLWNEFRLNIDVVFAIQHDNTQFFPLTFEYNDFLSLESKSSWYLTEEDIKRAYNSINTSIDSDIGYRQLYAILSTMEVKNNLINDVDSFLNNFQEKVKVDTDAYSYFKSPLINVNHSTLPNYKNISQEECREFYRYSDTCDDEMFKKLNDLFLYETSLINNNPEWRIECAGNEFFEYSLCEIVYINDKKFLVEYRTYLYSGTKTYTTFHNNARFEFTGTRYYDDEIDIEDYDRTNAFLLKKTLQKLNQDQSYPNVSSEEDLKKEWLFMRAGKSPIPSIYLKAYEDMMYNILIEDAIKTIEFK